MSILKNTMAEKFSQLPNELIEDTRISAKAFRVAAYLFSRPSGWEVRNDDIMKRLSINDEGSLAKYWKELIKAGWVTRQKQAKGDNGKFNGAFDYCLNIAPIISVDRVLPCTEKTQIRKKSAHGETPDLNNTDLVSNTDSLNNTDLAEKSATNKSPQKSIEERATAFREKIRQNKGDYTNAMLHEFFNYWTEHNDSGKKMRFELQKVFEIKKRLATWFSRSQSKTFTKGGAQNQDSTPAVYVRPKKRNADEQTPLNNLLANAAQKMSV